MIEPLYWGNSAARRSEGTPFDRQATQPLRLTFDTDSFRELTPRQKTALAILREFRNLDLIDAVETGGDANRRLLFGAPNLEGDVPVTIVQGEVPQLHVLARVGRQLAFAPAKARPNVPGESSPEDAAGPLVVLGAHQALDRHVLVSESPALFDPREYGMAKYGNPRRILDALRIVGLFLRTRSCYVYRVERPGFLESFDRGLFYWVLARHLTPSMWRYHSACHAAEKGRRDDTGSLGSSILRRCDRALQARDRIGQAFYCGTGGEVRDEAMYHFDYLTLLLRGALDAQARIAHRAYAVAGSEREAGFQRRRWLEKLSRVAAPLHDVLTMPHSAHLLTLLGSLRNTIHGAALPGPAVCSTDPVSTIEMERHAEATALRNACTALGSLAEWGFATERYADAATGERRERFSLEPYALAEALVRECLILIDAIAAATDVDRLLGVSTVPPLSSQPPEEGPFRPSIRERIALLG